MTSKLRSGSPRSILGDEAEQAMSDLMPGGKWQTAMRENASVHVCPLFAGWRKVQAAGSGAKEL